MKPAHRHEYSNEQRHLLKQAVLLEWVTLAYLTSVVVLMYLVMGSSQAMKSAWVEDILSMVPPLVFLITNKIRNMQPTAAFPYGFHRAASIGYLVSAIALLAVGGYLIADSGLKLLLTEHPTIGMKAYFGIDMWLGWWMILVLLWGTFPPLLLGHLKARLAGPLFDKVLYTDSRMNKADWMTAAAAMGGVIGIGFGIWWADAVAALVIAADIFRDGYAHCRDAVTSLINRAPRELDGRDSDVPSRVKDYILGLDWVDDAVIRMHEQGHLFAGEVFFTTKRERVRPEDIEAAIEAAMALDWRIQQLSLTVAEKQVQGEGEAQPRRLGVGE